ncbi:wax ester/triacylglycerol synthase family O-acyltransferase [soil metagenome]
MRRLSALDAQFLNVEDRSTFGHVGALIVLDPADLPDGRLDLDSVRAVLEPRLHLATPFRQRLVDAPLGVGYPAWVDDTDFDLEYHLREVGLPQPGTREQLGEQVARIHARPLDRSRPLWEMYLVHGLEDGRFALYSKVHHAAIDGISGAELLAVLMDPTPEPRLVEPQPWDPDRPPAPWTQLTEGTVSALTRSRDLVTRLPRALPYVTALPGGRLLPGARAFDEVTGVLRSLLGADEPPPRRALSAPRTPFNGPITAHRRFAYASLSLAAVKGVKNAFGLTVNDVVLALTAGALRRWLLDRDALPGVPLVTAVPVSVRDADSAANGNQVSVMTVALPTHLADPAERLAAVVADVEVAKAEFDALPATLLQDLSSVVPTALSGLAARALFRLVTMPGVPVNLFVSNVPGPQQPLWIAGARVEGVYPVSAVTELTGGLNITLFSYDGSLDVGLVACREMVPDVWRLAGYLTDELVTLTDLATSAALGVADS